MPSEPADNWLNALGFVGGAGLMGAAAWLKSYFSGRSEGEGEPHARHVILEQAELRDWGELPRKLDAVGARLDAVQLGDRTIQDQLDDQMRLIHEHGRILRRLENELDVARRLREEKLLQRQRSEEK